MNWDVIIVGAGVLGTFHAYEAAKRGLRTLLIERRDWPADASVRNFGMVIPSGMAPGAWLRRGLESAAVYRWLSEEIGFELHTGGTQYLASTPAELALLQRFASQPPDVGYRCTLLDARQSVEVNNAIEPAQCLGSLLFPDDLRIQPRRLFQHMIPWLVREQGVVYRPGTMVIGVTADGSGCNVRLADGTVEKGRHVFLCTGSEVRALFPTHFASLGLQHCKLSMFRTLPQPGLRLPTALASGLSLRRYGSFKACPAHKLLEAEPVDAELAKYGIHQLFVQNADGSVVLGDSHEYTTGDHDDTMNAHIEALILAEAQRIARLRAWTIAERWYGIYSLHPQREICADTLEGRVHVVVGCGGTGMTAGPALARESLDAMEN